MVNDIFLLLWMVVLSTAQPYRTDSIIILFIISHTLIYYYRGTVIRQDSCSRSFRIAYWFLFIMINRDCRTVLYDWSDVDKYYKMRLSRQPFIPACLLSLLYLYVYKIVTVETYGKLGSIIILSWEFYDQCYCIAETKNYY